MKERKVLLEDAKAATQAALEEGIVPGGGVALLRCEKAVDALKLEGDEGLGAQVLRNALEVPLRRIADNAGQDGAVAVHRVRQMKKNEGYDADRDEYGDMLAAGVVDPAKVVRTALENAASVAALLLTTSCLVTELPKKQDDKGHGGHGHPGMGGGMGGMGGGMGGMGGGMGDMGGMGDF
jgi:chaperonin GroEL